MTPATSALRVILVDNFDSFSWNLVDEFARRGAEVEVWRSTSTAGVVLERALLRAPALVVISPGPGTPADAGCSVDLVRQAHGRVPLLGVCLGHQAIVEALGGRVGGAEAILHGKTTPVEHDGSAAFAGVPSPFVVGRYHSLAAAQLPDELIVTATSGSTVMAVRDREEWLVGLQFHPESILTQPGGRIIENVMRWAGKRTGRPRRPGRAGRTGE